ncbi:MAG: magnesium chelatase subunit D family protein [Candidatus Electrothrix gigas]
MANIPLYYPFTALVGQEELKLALLLNAVNPRIGGVVICGEKGAAKSTAVRSLAALLPEIDCTAGCVFLLAPQEAESASLCGICAICRMCSRSGRTVQRPAQVITLPLNATEDRVVGGVDFDRTIQQGCPLQPGLLARAHQSLLYVDEVNLLDDHLVDLILAAASSGTNRIEREGLSFAHPTRFILVGTMNPEEGALRPQLLDRFGLCVDVRAEADREDRVLMMERREAFDTDPATFSACFTTENQTLARRIALARRLLPAVSMPAGLRVLISELCTAANTAGHRADLVMEQAALALAAFSERNEVTEEDVRRVAPLALRHREREAAPPPPPPPQPQEQQEQGRPEQPPEEQSNEAEQERTESSSPDNSPEQENKQDSAVPPDLREKVFAVGATFKVKPFTATKDRIFRRGSGRRSRSRINGLQGRYVKSTLPHGSRDIALDATIRAAAPYQQQRCQRQQHSTCAITLYPEDIREKVRERRIGNFLLFVVDASGSMGAQGRMSATKGAIMSLLLDAYQKRDKVAMLSFNKTEARLNLPPTSSIDTAARLLAELPTGGRTPLNAALVKADDVLRSQLTRDPTSRPIAVLITDGRSNVALGSGRPVDECLELARRLGREERVRFILVDTEAQGLIRFGLAEKIAQALQARYVRTADLKADTLLDIVKEP